MNLDLRFLGHTRARSLSLVLALASGPAHHAAPPAAPPAPASAHIVALNQAGYLTAAPKRFTAPLSPDGSAFEVRAAGTESPLFQGAVQNQIGDFSAFQPADAKIEYVVRVRGGNLQPGQSGPFSIRAELYQEQFWQTAVDFMIDCRSVAGTHPSAYGGSAWRDGTYYDFAVPSLVLLYLADPDRCQSMPRQIDWAADKARVLSDRFRFDANNPEAEGVMEAVRRYFTDLEPPHSRAPDVVKLIHWGLGYALFRPALRDPSRDPLPRQIHSQTVEQFAYFLHAWPHLETWLPVSFYERCRDFAFNHWREAGSLEIDPLWHPQTYLSIEQLGPNPMGTSLHPYKGRHAPGHSIQPNLLMHEVARREGRPDAAGYLRAAQTQAQWLIDHLDWQDPRSTKGHRMSEFKTVTGLVWFLDHFPEHAPPGLEQKVTAWARLMVQRSDNLWDFRRYDLDAHWTIPALNEPGNLAGFTAAALAAAWTVNDPALQQRLREIAFAQMDNLFGRNPKLAAAPHRPDRGFPGVELGWPKGFPPNVCARLETTRGSLSALPGSEMYPFNPRGAFRHPEGWVNFNAAWNVGLAYIELDERRGSRARK